MPIKLGLVPFFHPFSRPCAEFAARVGSSPENLIGLFLGTIVLLDVLLAVFNLLPIAPLDGFRVLVGLLPPQLGRRGRAQRAVGAGILMLLFFLPFLHRGEFNPLFTVIEPLHRLFLWLFAGDSDAAALASPLLPRVASSHEASIPR